eukprot:14515227-Alexandrium_andersonii.AAC.1
MVRGNGEPHQGMLDVGVRFGHTRVELLGPVLALQKLEALAGLAANEHAEAPTTAVLHETMR